jgi:PAS domain S-box-containing protein
VSNSSTPKKPTYEDLAGRIKELEDMVARGQLTEAKLIQNQGHFRELAELLPEAVYEADRNARLIYLNRNGMHQFGYTSHDNIRQLKVYDLIFQENQPKARENFIRITRGNETECHDYMAIRKDGSTFPALFLCTPVFQNQKTIGVRGFIRDISTCLKAQKVLQITHDELKRKAKKLEESNIALKVLLEQQDKGKADLAENVLANMETLILPHLERMKDVSLSPAQEAILNLLEADLRQIVSPFARSLSTGFDRLTPMEIRVADLVKQGKTTKEIARLLGLARSTIDTHRNHIREKLKIKKRKINLRTYLRASK